MRILLPLAVLAALPACATTTVDDDLDGREDVAAPACPTETRNWKAWVNAMPGPDARPTLIVQGEALMPEMSSVTMAEGPLDRRMPPGQRISIGAEPSQKAAGWQIARIDIAPALTEYREVVIHCDGAEVARVSPVEIAQ